MHKAEWTYQGLIGTLKLSLTLKEVFLHIFVLATYGLSDSLYKSIE